MELVVRVHHGGAPPRDLRIDADADQRVGAVTSAIAAAVAPGAGGEASLTIARTGCTVDADTDLASAEVLSGDDVIVGHHGRVTPVRSVPVRAATADVLAGPDAGISTILLEGHHTVGRDPSNRVELSDPEVGRQHLDVDIAADWSATITPVGAEHPVFVNDGPIDRAVAVGPDDVVTIGSTRLAFRPFVRSVDDRIDRLGQIEFHRTPYRPPVVAPTVVEPLASIPTAPEPRRFQVLTAVAPLAAGITMFAFTGQPTFLILTMLSPIMIVANWFEERRSGRHKHTKNLARFRERLGTRRAELLAAVEAERVARLRAAPDLAQLARRAELRTVDLWARGREAPDFLSLRVGLGTVSTLIDAPIERGGDDEFRDEAFATADGTHELRNVPITVDVMDAGVVGLEGADRLVSGIASSMVVQASCLHSPEDLIIAAAVRTERPLLHWLKWLPHVRSVTSPIGGPHIATDATGADQLLAQLVEVAEFRTSDTTGQGDRRWPWLLVVLDSSLHPNPVLVSQLLDACPAAGINVVWIADRGSEVPRQATRIIEATLVDGEPSGRLWSTDPDVATQHITIDRIRPDVAERAARALAPVRDASSGSVATSIPRTAPLLDVLGVGTPTASWVAENWLRSSDYGLGFPIGVGADGVVTLDLVADGPHTLIGGTSGAGKSELLQSMVAALAAHHSPERLNFLFVDYKGGASSNVFGTLPHTVGYVTNLSAELSLRALTSLRAELNRRMRIMEGRAKDLAEMLEVAPAEAPPSLVIIVDEFATLVKEIPEFVAGIVDIAQRGRSLGIHLVLATQRPSGSVNDNILANTNLRISLRMLDRSESTSVINSPEAAEIPVPLKGRGFARLGPRELVAFQSAFSGAPMTAQDESTPITISEFEATGDGPVISRTGSSGAATAGTHLDAVIVAIVAAHERLGLPAARRPWLDVLADHVVLSELLAEERCSPAFAHPGRMLTLGLVDAPEDQDQYPAIVDLEDGGGLMVFGAGGSGKTTLLRTAALSAQLTAPDGTLAIIGLDFASRGLGSIEVLPSTVTVATGDDLESVTRAIALLDGELRRRRSLLATSQAESLTSHLAMHPDDARDLPRILVLIDGFGGLLSAFADRGGGFAQGLDVWLDMIQAVITDGRQVGIHAVITADRRNAIPARLHAAISNRLILRQSDETSYAEHGIAASRAKGLDLEPGRGLWQGDATMQVACVSRDDQSQAQALALAEAASSIDAGRPSLDTAPLPGHVLLDDLDDRASTETLPLHAVVGQSDLTGTPAVVDLTWSHFVVSGPPRSGRSTTLVTLSEQLADGHDLWSVGPASSPLAHRERPSGEASAEPAQRSAFGRAAAVQPLLEQLATLLDMGPPRRQQVLFVDDLDVLDDPALMMVWDRLAKHDDLRVCAAIESRSLQGFSQNPMLAELRRARAMLLLQPADAAEIVQSTGARVSLRPGLQMVPGRGVFLADRQPTVVQVPVAR
jgi:S-DNA-T family DNA segregation ATPase FtsK/SpoIIIE